MYILLIALLLAVSVGMLSRAYRRSWSKRLNVSLRLADDGVFEGEQGEVTEVISNNKLTPVFWGYLRFRVPGPLCFDGADAGHDYYREDRVSVLAYEEISRTIRFTALRRGCYRLSGLQFTAGDLLFHYKMMRDFPSAPEIYVYPRVAEIGRFRIDYETIIGETAARRSLIEDPFSFRGIRDYSPFDSMKAVNWKATARTGNLKVNQYSTTQSLQIMLLVDLDGYNQMDGRQIKEDTIRTAACLARRLTLSGIASGFATNAADTLTGESIRTECGSGRGHFLHLMREMAKIDAEKLLAPFDRILAELPRGSRAKTQYILISYYYGEDLVRRLTRLQAEGLSVQWVFLNDKSRKIDFVRRPGMYVCDEI